jgi:hypothetical protein
LAGLDLGVDFASRHVSPSTYGQQRGWQRLIMVAQLYF